MSRDNWFPGKGSFLRDPSSNKVINPLLKLGLLERRDFEGGAVAAILTEWGYELLFTGKTSLPKDRIPGSSSTYPRYLLLYPSQREKHRPGNNLFADELDSRAASFIVMHRVFGVGNPDRFPAGAAAEDIAYYPETSIGTKHWVQYRRGDISLFLRDPDIDHLEEAGLIEVSDNTAIISEWGFEIIVTGSTAIPEKRIAGRSSTYRRYFELRNTNA